MKSLVGLCLIAAASLHAFTAKHASAWVGGKVPSGVAQCTPGDELCNPNQLIAQYQRDHVPTVEQAYIAYQWAISLAQRGYYKTAIEALDLVDRSLPRIHDHFALLRGDWLMESGNPQAACEQYKVASASLQSRIQILGDVGYARCLLRSRDARGEATLSALVKRYPALPERTELRLELAMSLEDRGQKSTAARLYRTIDLSAPETDVAWRAHQKLDALAQKGIHLPPLTLDEEMERAERLIAWGAFDKADQALTILAQRTLTQNQQDRLNSLKDKVSRLNVASTVVGYATPPTTKAANESDENPEQRSLALSFQRYARTRSGLAGLPPLRLVALVQTATRLQNQSLTEQGLAAALVSNRMSARACFDLAIRAVGLANEELLSKLFEKANRSADTHLAATYHLGRSYQRMGLRDKATVVFNQVIREADGSYYGLWAEQQLREQEGKVAPQPKSRESAETGVKRPQEALDASLASAVRMLAPLVASHAQAYPWIARAYDLLRLGETTSASEELFQIYQVYRQARNISPRRAGIVALYRGNAEPRMKMSRNERNSRKNISAASLNTLAQVAVAIGDTGTAIYLGGSKYYNTLPRSYAPAVERVAQKYHLDPQLLWAIVKTESAYQSRVISHVGAIGLAQIMPRTGRAIAQQLGRRGFNEAHLLDPEVNLTFSAWYVSKLLQRFKGHLPLVIAAYNGGPHNVKRWLAQTNPNTSMDVFLETIPYKETHRYVRRVLTGYLAYAKRDRSTFPRLAQDLPASLDQGINF